MNGKSIECATCSRGQEHDNSHRKSYVLTNAAPLCVRLCGKHADTTKAEQRDKKRKDDNKTWSDGGVEIHEAPMLRNRHAECWWHGHQEQQPDPAITSRREVGIDRSVLSQSESVISESDLEVNSESLRCAAWMSIVVIRPFHQCAPFIRLFAGQLVKWGYFASH